MLEMTVRHDTRVAVPRLPRANPCRHPRLSASFQPVGFLRYSRRLDNRSSAMNLLLSLLAALTLTAAAHAADKPAPVNAGPGDKPAVNAGPYVPSPTSVVADM